MSGLNNRVGIEFIKTDENVYTVCLKKKGRGCKAEIEKTQSDYITNDKLEIIIGSNLIPLITPSLKSKITSVRNSITAEFGVFVPPIRIRDSEALNPDEYVIIIQSEPVLKYRFIKDRIPVFGPGRGTGIFDVIDFELDNEPLYNHKIYWIKKIDQEVAEINGCNILNFEILFITQLKGVLKQNLSRLISYDDVKRLIDLIRTEIPALLNEIELVGIGIVFITGIIRDLIKNGITVNNLTEILELIVENYKVNKDFSHVSMAVCTRLSGRKNRLNL